MIDMPRLLGQPIYRLGDISLSKTDIYRLPYKQVSDIHLEFREDRYIAQRILQSPYKRALSRITVLL